MRCSCGLMCCFFFQAEDGIRDWSVTGVQTCALPIFTCHPGPEDLSPYISVGWSYVTGARMRRLHIVCAPRLSFVQRAWAALVRVDGRSEERRVGKEGGGRGWRSHEREEEDGWGRWVG